MTKYLKECIKEGLGAEKVRAATMIHAAPTAAKITVISDESGHLVQTSFSK
jgi:hypothetical protein